MIYTSLDKIVRRNLLAKRLPIHYYIEFLVHASSCLRELTMDSLKVINSVELTPNPYGACDLPCDFVDWVQVGVPQGQFVQPIPQRDTINNLTRYLPTGQPTTYGDPNTVNLDFPFYPGYWLFQNIDDLGENLGRLYGFNTGYTDNAFKVIRNRGQIQLAESFNGCRIVLDYISDGQCSDNATKVDPRAWATIEGYINWKRSPNADIERSPEGSSYYNQRRILRARNSDITPWDIRQTLYRNYKESIKN